MRKYRNFTQARQQTKLLMQNESRIIHSERWQSVGVKSKPEMAMHVVLNHSFEVPLFHTSDLSVWRGDIQPNLPWADDHFEERVCGEPLNPGKTWQSWPYAHSANTFRDEHGQFNHNYMERYWPRFAGLSDQGELKGTIFDVSDGFDPNELNREAAQHRGIRHRYGDLSDLVDLLVKEPDTRQAYLPVWFPEDTGVAHDGRKPCTLGYLFDVIDSRFNVVYYIRSCDMLRHFNDDIYLTVRLLLWIRAECIKRGGSETVWNGIKPGTFTMHIRNLHIFRNDWTRVFG